MPEPVIYDWIVDSAESRLDHFLARQLPDMTRTRLQNLVSSGHVTLNDAPAKPSQRLRLSDRIKISIPPPDPSLLLAEKIHLDVIFEDEHLIAINKPHGLVVHPAPGHATGTLVHALLHHCAGSLSGIGGVMRPGIVHRLDQDTSGVIIAAKHDAAHEALARQFKDRTLDKTYVALVTGTPPQAQGEINAPIGRHWRNRKKMAISEKGKEARTLYKVAERFPSATLLECRILTGRTHQIRVHLASLGCPIMGDRLYGKAGSLAERQMLHAACLKLAHPISGAPLVLHAPLTEDFIARLNALRNERIKK